MNIGDLVRMRPAVAPPKLYGIGIVVKVDNAEMEPTWHRCHVRWPTMPDRELKPCHAYALELVSAAR